MVKFKLESPDADLQCQLAPLKKSTIQSIPSLAERGRSGTTSACFGIKTISDIPATLGVRQIWHSHYGLHWLTYPIRYYKYLLKNSHFKHLPVFWSARSFLTENTDTWVSANRKDINPVQMISAWNRENACSGEDSITVSKVNPKATQIEFRSIKAGRLLLWNDL